MEKNFTSKDIWNKASSAALIVGIIPVIYTLATILLSKWISDVSAINILRGMTTFLLWAAKVIGCILLMKFFMAQFKKSFTGVDRHDLFKFGTAIALLSAVIVATFELFDSIYLEPGKLETVMEAMQSSMSSLDSNSQDALNRMSENFPQIAFAGSFIYCVIFGVVLSAIFAASESKSTPFEQDDKSEEEL